MGFGKDGKGVIITDVDTITLGTLANVTAIKQGSPLAMLEDFRLIKLEMAIGYAVITAGENPINIYLVNNDLTVAEVAEAIVTAGPLNRNERIATERASRAVFLLATAGGPATDFAFKGHDGQEGIISKVIRWTFSNPEGWSIVAFNNSGSALTTGTIIRFSVKYFGVWVD